MIDEKDEYDVKWLFPLKEIYRLLENADDLRAISIILNNIFDPNENEFLSIIDFISRLDEMEEENFIEAVSCVQAIIARFIWKYQESLGEIIRDYSRTCIRLEILWAWSCGKNHDNRILSPNDKNDLKIFDIMRYPIQIFNLDHPQQLTETSIIFSEEAIVNYLNERINREYLLEQEEADRKCTIDNAPLYKILLESYHPNYNVSYFLNESQKSVRRVPMTGEQLITFLLRETAYPLLLCEIDRENMKSIKGITLMESNEKVVCINSKRNQDKAFRNNVKYYIRKIFEASLIDHSNGIGKFELTSLNSMDIKNETFSKYATWTNSLLSKNFSGKRLEDFIEIDSDRINYKDQYMDSPLLKIRYRIISNICLIE